MRVLQAVAVLTSLPIIATACEVHAYDNVDDCEPTDDSNYKHFQGTVDGTGCVNIGASSPPSGVTCSLYTNGGNADPAARNDANMKGDSAWISEITDVGAKKTCYGCVFFEAADCNENIWIVVGDAQCPDLSTNPAMSFRCSSVISQESSDCCMCAQSIGPFRTMELKQASDVGSIDLVELSSWCRDSRVGL